MQNFGNKLKEIRKSLGYTQEALGEKIGVTARVIGYYESESKYPPAKILTSLAEALNTPIQELLDSNSSKLDGRTVDAKFWPKWEKLSEDQKKAVTKVVDTFLG